MRGGGAGRGVQSPPLSDAQLTRSVVDAAADVELPRLNISTASEVRRPTAVDAATMDENFAPFRPEPNYSVGFNLMPPTPPGTQLHEMQPPPPQYDHSPMSTDYHQQRSSSSNILQAYLTVADGGGGGSGGGLVHSPSRRDFDSASGSSRMITTSDYDDDTGDDARSVRTNDSRRQNHSEIEKRRRDKMNNYIAELCSVIPMCNSVDRKLDKLTVLRMAVQHLKSVHSAGHVFPEGRFAPKFLSERELKMLILQAAEGFIFVADCDRGRMMYVSDSVKQILHYEKNDLLGQSLFDILHPKDIAKVKEQLSSPEFNSRDRLIDSKTMLPVHMDLVLGTSRLCPGSRRSFFCRMKIKPNQARHNSEHISVKQGHSRQQGHQMERKYCVIQCTGYLKPWAVADVNSASHVKTSASVDEDNGGSSSGSIMCLVAVGRDLPELPHQQPDRLVRRLQFLSRHTPDGKFIYVDQRVTPALGYLPQELLGSSLYEYVEPSHLADLARTHKSSLVKRTSQCSAPYNFRRKDRSWSSVQTDWRPFRNPWTKELECLFAQNTILELYTEQPAPVSEPHTNDYFLRVSCAEVSESDQEMQISIDTQIESHKIGTAITDEVQIQENPPDETPPAPIQDQFQEIVVYNPEVVSMNADDNAVDEAPPQPAEVDNNMALSANAQQEIEDVLQVINSPTFEEISPPDGHDEASMSVIMSLLEADAGLGGPVDFSGLPWPLP